MNGIIEIPRVELWRPEASRVELPSDHVYVPEGAALYDWLTLLGNDPGGAPVALLDLTPVGNAIMTFQYPVSVLGGMGNKVTFVYEYDFAVDAGAIGTITLRAPGQTVGQTGPVMPTNFILANAFVDVITAFTGATAQMALSVQTAGDLVAATVVTGAPYSTTGIKATVPVWTAAAAIKLTASRQPTAVITVAGVTAGKFRVYIEGYLS